MIQTPKQKAKELWMTFSHYSSDEYAKYTNCIRCVEEIIKSSPSLPYEDTFDFGFYFGGTEGYWQKVKEEIDKLYTP